ncbi:unnamed protein product [Discula destructiva]
MGLPLYRAPVESDIKARIPKDPPTRARSTIRRSAARRAINDSGLTPSARFYARRQGRVSPGAETPWTPWDNVASGETAPLRSNAAPRTGLRRATTLHDAMAGPPPRDSTRPPIPPVDSAMREWASSGLDEERYFGAHMAMLHAATSSRTHAETPSDGDETEPTTANRWASMTRDRPTPPSQMPPSWEYPRQSDNSGSARPRDSGSQPPARVADVVLRRQDGHLIAMRRLRAVRAARGPAATDAPQQLSQAQPPVDGLGDRNRSLSPEDEGVWDTLLSSITPDPQPPSVGASFASTSAPASGSTSQNTSSAHSQTTAPTTIEALEFDFEHPCESGGDNSDTEGEDDDLSQLTLRRFERSYADVTRSQREDDDLEIMGGVESMQRIVRNLARREDIPDEWWADAGLSRSLQREAA